MSPHSFPPEKVGNSSRFSMQEAGLRSLSVDPIALVWIFPHVGQLCIEKGGNSAPFLPLRGMPHKIASHFVSSERGGLP